MSQAFESKPCSIHLPLLKLQAAIKLNLNLQILGQREDGYHLLDSHELFLSGGDELIFYPRKKNQIKYQNNSYQLWLKGNWAKGLANDRNNLVHRAVQLLQEQNIFEQWAGDFPYDIELTKNIPMGSGLAGGTADAVMVLVLAVMLLGLPENLAAELSKKLGADAFGLWHGYGKWLLMPASKKQFPLLRVTGIGDEVAILRRPKILKNFYFLLARGSKPCSTLEIFQHYDRLCRNKSQQQRVLKNNLSHKLIHTQMSKFYFDMNVQEFFLLLQNLGNDLLPAANFHNSEINDVIVQLQNCPNCHYVGMSGSGSVCYGIFTNKESAEHGHKILSRQPIIAWSQITQVC